jgi:uncharacterized protein YndB with AHSA1/START domain
MVGWMAEYAFLTAWRVAATREAVFEVLHESERWPEWWDGLESVVRLEDGDVEGRGSLGRYTWRSFMHYRLAFEMRITRVERPYRMDGSATGELTGTGSWRLYEDDGATAVLFEWRVRTTRGWMNLLTPVARPLFKWNHDRLMRAGGRGLARRLGVELLSGA